MTPAQYLAACKVKLGHCTDYALAKKWDLNNGYMSKVMRGTRPINAHVAFLIAVTLELDPAFVLSDIEAQQQTGKAQEFWKGFLLRAGRLLALTACTLALMLSGFSGSAPGAIGGGIKRRRYFA